MLIVQLFSDPNQLADQVRSKVKALWKCDINAAEDKVIENGTSMKKFDTIMANLITSAFATTQAYAEGMKKLAQHLNPNGYLVMIGTLEGTDCKNSKITQRAIPKRVCILSYIKYWYMVLH